MRRTNFNYRQLAVLAARTFPLIWGLVCVAVWGCGSKPSPRLYRRSQLLMGTLVEIKVVTDHQEKADRALEAALGEIKRIEELMSRSRPESEIWKINHSAGRPAAISRELASLLEDARKIGESSAGAFDVSIGALSLLWGFEEGNRSVPPTPSELAQASRQVDYRKIELLSGPQVVIPPRMRLDLGAIAKGYAVDCAINTLQSYGLTGALVDAGGDIRVIGRRADGKRWHIGLQNSRDRDKISATIRLADQAIVTSGDYERYFIYQGVRYHHILDPKTGYPARDCQSVTVLANTAAKADAWATAIFVSGLEKGAELASKVSDIEVVIVDITGKIHYLSPALEGRLQIAQEGSG